MKFVFSVLFCCVTIISNAQMTIKVVATPQLTPLLDDIYIAGSFNDWQAGDVAYVLSDQNGILSVDITAQEGEQLEFKFTRGTWQTVEGNVQGAYIPNRTLTYHANDEVELSITGWEDLPGNHSANPHVRILDSDFYMPQLERSRRIWILFPTDYNSSDGHYPVVYLHDGQNIFDHATSFAGEWRIDETMALPSMSGCKQAIFVAIDNGGSLRLDELSPWYNQEYDGGGEGGLYTDFIVQTLKPFIDSSFRTLPDRNNTTIGGSSLGGLLSMYAWAKYNNVFSRAAIFSPAFWFNPEIYDYVASQNIAVDSRIYFVCGTHEGTSMVPNMQQMRDQLTTTLSEDQIGYLVVQGGQHNENFWANQFAASHHFLAPCAVVDVDALREASNVTLVFPNPFSDTLHIAVANGYLENCVITDLQGREVLEQRNSAMLHVGQLARGTYHVTIQYINKNGELKREVKSLVKP
jgi:predicted alpha/beta superfamily hydrolase